MRRWILLCCVVLVLAAVPVASSAFGSGHAPPAPTAPKAPRSASGSVGGPTARIAVKPATGSPQTRFVVSFRAPALTGHVGSSYRRYELNAIGRARSGCIASPSVGIPPSGAGARVRAELDPRRLGGSWCAGTFHGRVVELETPICATGAPCPQFVLLLRTVGKFSFQVSAVRH